MINLTNAIAIINFLVRRTATFTLVSHLTGIAYTYSLNEFNNLKVRDVTSRGTERWLPIGTVKYTGDLKIQTFLPAHSTRRRTAEWLFNHKLPKMLRTEDPLTGCDFLVNPE